MAGRGELCRAMERVVNFVMMQNGERESEGGWELVRRETRRRRAQEDQRVGRGMVGMFLKEKRDVVAKLLGLNISRWKTQEIPAEDIYMGKISQIDSPSKKVSVFNAKILKGRYRAETDTRLPVGENTNIPEGLTVFEPLPTGNEDAAFEELITLFDGEWKPGAEIKYFTKPNPTYMPEVLDDLRRRNKIELLRFIHAHLDAIKATLNAEPADMEKCSLTFVKYSAGEGLIAHIDGIQDFGETFGPIFTINMGEGEKILDLLPVATTEELSPVRIFTRQYDITMLQGCARTGYAHSIPFGHSGDMYTIAIKFRAIASATQAGEYRSDKFGAVVPIIQLRTQPP